RVSRPRWLAVGGLLPGVLAPALISGCGTGTAPVRAASAAPPASRRVETLRAPDGGYQAQAAVDGRGVTHVVYLMGEAGGADLFYRRRENGARAAPLQVRPGGGAVGARTIRGPQLALGRSGRAHVVWFGSAKSGVIGPEGSAPLLYSRLNEGGGGFEPARNVMGSTTSLDGGPGIAADQAGNVYVVWHAAEKKGQTEAARKVWVARSTDDGKSFSRETAAWNEATGVCPCCSTEAFADSKGAVYALYRMAANRTERDMVLLTSTDQGRTFNGSRIDAWPVDT
ncbi:MAG: hypothetical protein ACO1SX_17035, partial [Actinomycetota bacterium]